MFAFGFGGMFIITQMHGLGLSKTVRWLLVAAYVVLTLWVYNGRWAALNEIVRIPFIEYLSVFALAGIFWLILRIMRRFQSKRLGTAQEYA